MGITTNTHEGLKNTTGDLNIINNASNGDVVIKGNDAGSTITALTLDMSEGGNATFTGTLTVGTTAGSSIHMLRTSANYINATNSTGYLVFRTGGYDTALTLDASQNATFAGTLSNTGDVTITNGNLIFSSMHGVRFNDANTRIYTNSETPEDLIIEADQDLLITPDGQVRITGNADISGNLVLGSYTVASQGNQGIFGKLSSFQNSGSTNLFLGIKNSAYPNRGWSFDPVLAGVNCNLIIKEHGSTAERIKISTGGNFEVLTGSVTATGLDINGNADISGTLDVAGVATLANVGYLGDGLGSVQYTLKSANNGVGTIDFGDVADVNIGRLQYNHVDDSFFIRTNNATALTLDSSQNATFAGTLTVAGNTVKGYATGTRTINDSSYTMIGTVSGDRLSSVVDLTLTGTSNAVVIASRFEIIVQHHRDIYVRSMNGDYKDIKIKITSNDNEDFSIEAMHAQGSTTDTALEVCIYPRAGEICEVTATDPGYSGDEFEFTTSEGTKFGASDNLTTGHRVQIDGHLDVNGTADISGALTGVDAITMNGALSGASTITASGEIEGGSLDINGNADISGNLTLSGTYPRILLTDSNSNDDYSIINDNGTFIVYNDTDSSTAFAIAGNNNATFSGDLTINDISGTRGISRNNTGYNLQLMGGTDNSDGAFISLSGETRGGTSNAYNGRIEIYSGGGGLANQAAALGDIIFGTKWNGGSSNILVLDSSTNNATFAGTIGSGAITSTGAIKQGSRITLNTNGTITWGSANAHGLLSWDTGYSLINGLSGNGIKFGTNGSTLALTLDTSQNATFAGNVTAGSNSLTAGSLDINGNADISGNLSGVDTLTCTDLTIGSDATTAIGKAYLKTPNVSTVSYQRINADETLSLLNAAQMLSAIGGVAPNQNTSGSSGSCTGNSATATKISSITNTNIVQLSTTTTQTGTKTFSGVIDITNTTASSNATGDTGALRCEGGASIAGKIYAGSTITGSADVIAFSDRKLKENIETLDGKKVLDMRGVSFTRKDSGKESSGVIAQEIQKVAPELVHDTEGTLGVAYGNLVGYLIEAIKDQQKQIDELKEICNGCSK